MAAEDVGLAIGTMLAGIAAGTLVTRYYFKRGGSARTKLSFSLSEVLRLDETTVGTNLSLKFGVYNVTNLAIYRLTVRNLGPGDVVVADASDQTKHHLRPRLELPGGLRVIVDPWTPGGALPRSEMRVARSLRDGTAILYIHLHRLAEGQEATAIIICTARGETIVPAYGREDFSFFAGFLPGVEVKTGGLLFRAPNYLA